MLNEQNRMHETLLPSIRGFIDSCTKQVDGRFEAVGWCMYPYHTHIVLQAVSNDTVLPVQTSFRSDVARCYGVSHTECTGWKVLYAPTQPVELQLKTDIGGWKTVFVLNKGTSSPTPTPTPTPTLTPSPSPSLNINQIQTPTFLVIDNFYEAPDDVRALAMSCNFNSNSPYFKGNRTPDKYLVPGIKERFEKILGRSVINWDKYGTNGCFHYCVGGEQLVYHHDSQQYAGVLYLTPDAPVDSGTSLYRSKMTNSMSGSGSEYSEVYPRGHLDPSQFERVDTVGNVYNRLILFNSHMIHAASSYFGNSKESGRLVQLFFFDLAQS